MDMWVDSARRQWPLDGRIGPHIHKEPGLDRHWIQYGSSLTLPMGRSQDSFRCSQQEVKESTGEINGQRSIRKGGNIGEGEEPDNGDELERQGELSNGKRKKKRRVEDREAHTRAKSQPIGTLASVPDAATKQKHDHGRLSSLTTSRGAFVSKSYVGATSFKVYNYEIGDWNVGQLFNKFQADTTSIVSSCKHTSGL